MRASRALARIAASWRARIDLTARLPPPRPLLLAAVFAPPDLCLGLASHAGSRRSTRTVSGAASDSPRSKSVANSTSLGVAVVVDADGHAAAEVDRAGCGDEAAPRVALLADGLELPELFRCRVERELAYEGTLIIRCHW
jgi:hypothetical protein